MNPRILSLLWIRVVCGVVWGLASPGLRAEGEWNPDIQYPPLPPAEALKTFEVPKGYHLQCVASEPMVEEPVMFAFDGNGALYVCEWRTYMQDEHGTDQLKPESRVVKLVDTDGDGVMDRRTVFLDHVILPRAVQPLHDRVLVYFTESSTVYAYFDDNHDGVADRREVAWLGADDHGNNEHQQSGFVWNLDNTFCTNDRRFSWESGRLTARPHARSRLGQYGLARDDDGRLFCSYGGGGNPAHSFQLPAGYPVLNLGGREHAAGYDRTWGICPVWDESDGEFDVERRAVLKRFTAACGQTVLRSHLMPEWYGNAVTCEPVGRLLRMTRVEWKDGLGTAHNPFPESEFIRSSDGYFRPVWTETGPDGAFYFADMYRGIIQEKTWFPTSMDGKYGDWRDEKRERWVARYERVKKWGMTKVVRHGRIYRLVPDGSGRQPEPRMLEESAEQLVAHLAHPNGWWRDQAHKLIVTRGGTAAVGALSKMASEHRSPDARILSLWALKGLGALEKSQVIAALGHAHPRVRRAAVQLAEPDLIGKDDTLRQILTKLAGDPDPHVATQVFLAFRASAAVGGFPVPESLVSGRKDLALVPLIRAQDEKDRARILTEAGAKGKQVYETLCIACHGPDGEGVRTAENKSLAPALTRSEWFLGGGNVPMLARIVLKGLTGPIAGQTYGEGLMMPLEATHTDEQIAQVLTYIGQQWHGWKAPVEPREIRQVRQEISARTQPWTYEELQKILSQRESAFFEVPLGGSATADGRSGVYANKEKAMDRVWLRRYGMLRVHGVPFMLPDPEGSPGGRNVIVLRGGATPDAVSQSMPDTVEIPVQKAGGRLHLLGAVAGWGWPAMKQKETLLLVTVHYQDDSREELAFVNGIDIADHAAPVEVPGSVSAGVVGRGQMRYLWRDLSKPGQVVEKITVKSLGKMAAPLVAALTLEAPGASGKMAPAPLVGGPVPSGSKLAENGVRQTPEIRLPGNPVPGKLRVLFVGGGQSHDFGGLFDAVDRDIVEGGQRAVTAYVSEPESAAAEISRAEVLVLSANAAGFAASAQFREALKGFVEKGGGMVLLHPGVWYNWPNWPEYNERWVGGGARRHEPQREFEVRVGAEPHPVLSGVSPAFLIRDELYQVVLAPECRVLAEAVSQVTGGRYPTVWIVPHVSAKILCVALGHGKEAHQHPDFAALLRNAVKWAGAAGEQP